MALIMRQARRGASGFWGAFAPLRACFFNAKLPKRTSNERLCLCTNDLVPKILRPHAFMKRCTYCGNQQPDEATNCPVDGQPLEAVIATTAPTAPTSAPSLSCFRRLKYAHFSDSAGNDALIIVSVGLLLHWMFSYFVFYGYLVVVLIVVESLSPTLGGIIGLYAVIKGDGRISGIGACVACCIFVLPAWFFWHGQFPGLYENASLIVGITWWICGIGLIREKIAPMKVKRLSLILAALFLVSGHIYYLMVPKFALVFADLVTTLPIATRVVLAFPIGLLLIGYALSFAVLAKDKGTRSRLLNAVFFVVFLCGLVFIAYALFSPLVLIMNKVGADNG
jgi:hypothetical protein